MVKIPLAKLQALIPKLFHNKVILSFVGGVTRNQIDTWIEAFNEGSHTKLHFVETLINSLHVVTVEEGLDVLSLD